MFDQSAVDGRLESLISAFNSDRYSIDRERDVVMADGSIGIRATHMSAAIGTTSRMKKAFYLEGDSYTMGYLLGRLAEPDVERMCTEFNHSILFDFINLTISDHHLR